MDEQTVNQLDNLLLQLGIETRELAQKKDNIKHQIQICESNIQEKKSYINTTHKTIGKLEEEIQQKQSNVKFIKENTKNFQRTGNLLLQYEKTLEAELEKRQDSYNQDMKLFQERMESYRSVFEQYKDRYCQNPLAQKLLNIQAKNEEIEKRIRATEEQITEKERELTAALGEDEPETEAADSYENIKCHDSDGLQTENCDAADPHRDSVAQRPEDDAGEHMTAEDHSEEEKDKKAEGESQMDTFSKGLWTMSRSAEDQMHGGDRRSEKGNEQEGNIKVSHVSDLIMETSEEKEKEDHIESNTAAACEEAENDGVVCPPPSPARIRAAPSTPTFSLNSSSPISSPGGQEISDNKSPAFVFSMSSGPNTPAFSKLGCDFDVGPAAGEASPFSFTSSYFGNKKSPGTAPKFSGFLFDETENRQEEFSFSFGTQSPSQSSNTQETPGPSDPFPFSFNFGN